VCWQPRPPLVTWSGPHRPARRGARFRSLRRLAIGSVGLRWCRKLGLHLLREHARGPIDDHAAYGIGLRRRTNRWNCRFALADAQAEGWLYGLGFRWVLDFCLTATECILLLLNEDCPDISNPALRSENYFTARVVGLSLPSSAARPTDDCWQPRSP
jgi:hypothetical protein